MVRIPEGLTLPPVCLSLPLLLILPLVLSACVSAGEKIDTAKGRALYMQGEELYKKREYARAVDKYTAALAANPHDPDAYYKRGRARLNLVDDPTLNPTELKATALKDFDAAINALPSFFEAYMARAVVYANQRNYKAAARDLVYYCLNLKKDDREAHLMLAKLLDQKFEDKELEALKHYQMFLELGGIDPDVSARVEALKALHRATEEEEKAAAQLYAGAIVDRALGRKDDALKKFRDLRNKYSHTQLARERQREIEQAVQELERK